MAVPNYLNYNFNWNNLGGLVTITGQDGKPVQVPANILQTQMQSSIASGIDEKI